MRLEFGPEDDDGFVAARNVLLERFERWLTEVRPESGIDAADMAGDAGACGHRAAGGHSRAP